MIANIDSCLDRYKKDTPVTNTALKAPMVASLLQDLNLLREATTGVEALDDYHYWEIECRLRLLYGHYYQVKLLTE